MLNNLSLSLQQAIKECLHIFTLSHSLPYMERKRIPIKINTLKSTFKLFLEKLYFSAHN